VIHVFYILLLSLIVNGTYVYYVYLQEIYETCILNQVQKWFFFVHEKKVCKPYSITMVNKTEFKLNFLYISLFFSFQAFLNTIRDFSCITSKIAGLSIKDFTSALFSNFNYFDKLLIFTILIKLFVDRHFNFLNFFPFMRYVRRLIL